MEYKANSERGLLIILLLTNIFPLFISDFTEGFIVIRIILILFICIALFIKYSIIIEDDFLVYRITLFNKQIYKVIVYPNQIVKIKFKVVGWSTRCAVIKRRNGISVRLTKFLPSNLLEELTRIAVENEIPIVKSKDYQILDR